MLKQLRLTNFRTFKSFTVNFGDGAYLVGPNNAGKTTLLTALRTSDAMLRWAYRRKSDDVKNHNGAHRPVYPISLRDFPALQDSLRHEFGQSEARIELEWKSGARLVAVWPEENSADDEPFFYLESLKGIPIKTPSVAKKTFPPLGVIPTLSPVEYRENLLDEKYVTRNIASRLSSRHFRNQLWQMKVAGDLDTFLEWAQPWLLDIEIESVDQVHSLEGAYINVYYREANSRVPKELTWAGDGIQIWLQLLSHIYRVRESDVLILDEPEIYLHPDLQRRLIETLESLQKQIVLASHSPEVLTTCKASSMVLIDKTRARAIRPREESQQDSLSNAIGTAFNLRLARALRAKTVLFVEGQDMTLLRAFAKRLGLDRVAAEEGLAIIPLQGYSNWKSVKPFAWLLKEFLPSTVSSFVILDRDYRSDAMVDEVLLELKAEVDEAHIWGRKEIESYVLNTDVIARRSGAPSTQIEAWLAAAMEVQKTTVFSRMLAEKHAVEVTAKNHAVSVTERFSKDFEDWWKSENFRIDHCPPKQLLGALNRELQAAGFSTVSAAGLAHSFRVSEIPQELAETLRSVDELLDR